MAFLNRRRKRLGLERLESRRLLSVVTEYPAPNGSNGTPSQITVGPNNTNTLWYTDPGGNVIGSLNTSSPSPQSYNQTLPAGSIPDGIALGPDGNLWFTEQGANQIGVINLSGTAPTPTGISSKSHPAGITSADGYLWFTQPTTDQIGRLDPNTGHITEYPGPAALAALDSKIILGPDGNLWFTEFGAIGIFSPKTDALVNQVSLPGGVSKVPFGIAAGPDGNIWDTAGISSSYSVGVINTNTQTFIKEIPVASASEPFGITAGPDGNIWFTVTSSKTTAGTIDVLNPATDTITQTLNIPTNVVSKPNPAGIAAGPDGNIWFTDAGGAIGRVILDTQLVVTAQPPPDVSVGSPFGVTITDKYTTGTVDTAFNGSVSIALSTTPGTPIATVSAVSGVATFTGLSFSAVGTDTLKATSNATNGPASVTTNSFNVVNGPATHLVVTTEPPASVATGSGFDVTVTDEYVSGPVDTSFTASLSISLTSNPSVPLATVSATNGVATFTGLTIATAGSGLTLTISGGGQSATTTPFNVTSPPTIVLEQVVTTQKRNKKGKPVGKPVFTGFAFEYSTSMSQSAAVAANYVVDTFVTKRVKRKTVTVLRPINFTASYNAATNTVSLTIRGKQKFPKGGQITVIGLPPSGVRDTSGEFLDGGSNAVFTISPKAKGITGG
jgi:streptogramin lyase